MEVTAANSDLYYQENQKQQPKQVLDKDAFLRIMIEQLKNQDPTSPLDSDKFVSQMAQFTTLEQLTNLNDQFGEMLQLQQLNQGSAMLGKQVSVADGDGAVTGTVERVITQNETVQVVVNGTAYPLNQVLAVEEAAQSDNSEGMISKLAAALAEELSSRQAEQSADENQTTD